ncbi:MAG: hypothetical protein M1814_000120 [Vezdaea aestivalis]|nr:MAG: hypothetical protein M1814_000120 [Vezdaea aestivalis]
MNGIPPFAVEQWMDHYQPSAKYDIAETCCASISLRVLQGYTGRETLIDYSTKLAYGSIKGSPELRGAIASRYESKLDPSGVLVTQGAISANFIVLYSLVRPGDHVICMYPTYQQLYSVPESLGAQVSKWALRERNNWIPQLEDLEKLLKPNTKVIIVNNPNNPTGAVVARDVLEGIVAVADQRGITVLCDEVYRPLFHGLEPQTYPPSMLDLGYHNLVVTGSLSKAFSLAGLRVGWIASHNKRIMESFASSRDYTTISVSGLDDQVAAHALSPSSVGGILQRNMDLAKTNLETLATFVKTLGTSCEWIKPQAGTTAFIKILKGGKLIDDERFCRELHSSTGVMLVPGGLCFGDGTDFSGFVRVGYACESSVLKEGLTTLADFIESYN